MIDNKCWHNINLDTSFAINPSWQFPIVDNSARHICRYSPSEIFSTKWLEYMKNNSFDVSGAMIFYGPPNFQNIDAHVDLMTRDVIKPAIYALNWIIGGKYSEMVWYNMPDISNQEIKWTPANTPFMKWPVSSLNEVDRHSISTELTMVRVDIPHAIFVKDEPRWCISIRINDIDSIIDWQSAIDYFDSKNLIR